MKQTINTSALMSPSGDCDRPDAEEVHAPVGRAYRKLASRVPARAKGDGYERLTGRERSIVSQLVKYKGAPNKVIAYALQISPNTLRNHLASIYAKLGVRRRIELVLYAMERDLDAVPGD